VRISHSTYSTTPTRNTTAAGVTRDDCFFGREGEGEEKEDEDKTEVIEVAGGMVASAVSVVVVAMEAGGLMGRVLDMIWHE
jgi:hypothetical protein